MQNRLRTYLATGTIGLLVGVKAVKAFIDKDPLVTGFSLTLFDLEEEDQWTGNLTGVRVFDQNNNMVAEFADLVTMDVASTLMHPLLPCRLSSVRQSLSEYSDFLLGLQEEV